MNIENYFNFKDKEVLEFNDVKSKNTKFKFPLFLFSYYEYDLNKINLEDEIDEINIYKAINYMNEYQNLDLILIVGDYKRYLYLFKEFEEGFLEGSGLPYVLTHLKRNSFDIDSLINRNNWLFYIDKNRIDFKEYSSEQQHIHYLNYGISPVANFKIINEITTIKYKEYKLATLLKDFSYELKEKFLNNVKKPLINEIINFYVNNKYLRTDYLGSLETLLNHPNFDNLCEYSLEVINNILNLDFFYEPVKLSKEDFEDNLEKIIKHFNNLEKREYKNTNINLKEALSFVNDVVDNEKYLLVLNDHLYNHMFFKIDEKYEPINLNGNLVYLIDNKIKQKDILKQINEYEIYTIITLKETKTMIYDDVVYDTIEYKLSRMLYWSDLFGFPLDEFIMAVFISDFPKEYQNILVQNINSNLMQTVFYKLKTCSSSYQFEKLFEEKLLNNKINFNETCLG